MKVVIGERFNVVFLANNHRIQQAGWSSILYWSLLCPVIAFNLVLKSRVQSEGERNPSSFKKGGFNNKKNAQCNAIKKFHSLIHSRAVWISQWWSVILIQLLPWVATIFHHNMGNRNDCVDIKIVLISFILHLFRKTNIDLTVSFTLIAVRRWLFSHVVPFYLKVCGARGEVKIMKPLQSNIKR